jgi:nitric oxide dioxygenase
MGGMLTPEAIRLVRTTWAQIQPIADVAVTLFYDRLFTVDPALRNMFKADLAPQKRALIGTLTMAIDSLDRLDDLLPVVQQLGVRHAGYGVQPEHYATVGSAFLWTLEQGLGPSFTPAVKAAWTSVYEVLATTMQGAKEHARYSNV